MTVSHEAAFISRLLLPLNEIKHLCFISCTGQSRLWAQGLDNRQAGARRLGLLACSADSDKSLRFEPVCNFQNEKVRKALVTFPSLASQRCRLIEPRLYKDFNDDKPGGENIYLSQRKPGTSKKNQKFFFF